VKREKKGEDTPNRMKIDTREVIRKPSNLALFDSVLTSGGYGFQTVSHSTRSKSGSFVAMCVRPHRFMVAAWKASLESNP